ncbi:MAG: class I SAM-dependent methyltransferase [Acidobacteriaceae bacterium]|nr:class I SAM-dependent methyltransferase [Acidobacteriaceae bacterium]
MTAAANAFDTVAPRYGKLWDSNPVGMFQRRAVWRHIDRLFRPGDRILDLGCGTGVDALRLRSRGIRVHGIDGSAEMIRISRAFGVASDQLPLDTLSKLRDRYDGALSNFGALNCADNLQQVASDLAQLIRSGGYAALCLMGPLCLWEILHFLLRGDKRAFRRLSPVAPSSLGIEVRYPDTRALIDAFRPHFNLTAWYGIGICVPPSYVRNVKPLLSVLAAIDRVLSAMPVIRGLADHRLYIFRRL